MHKFKHKDVITEMKKIIQTRFILNINEQK